MFLQKLQILINLINVNIKFKPRIKDTLMILIKYFIKSL